MKIPRDSAGRRGFTLIEILAILVVAAIVLPAVLMPLTAGIRDLDRPARLVNLTFLAQEVMEREILPADYDQIFPRGETPVDGFPGYTSSWTVSEDPGAGVKEITVTVAGDGESIDLVTVKTDWKPRE